MAVSDYLTRLGIDVGNINEQLSSVLGQKYFNKTDVVTTKLTIGAKDTNDTYVLFKIKNGEAISRIDMFRFAVLSPEDMFIVDEVEL